MTEKDKNRLGYALVDLYILLYKTKYKRDPSINRWADHYKLMDIIDQFGFDRAKEIIEYYFKTERQGHPITELMMNYHRIAEHMERVAEREAERARVRQETKKRVEEYRELQNRTRSN